MSWTDDEVEKAFVEVRKKAVLDKSFREKVLADPNKAIAEVAGKEIPDAVKIKVVEGDPKFHMTFVLPDMVSEEFTDEALESVVGGLSGLAIVSVCAAAVGGGGGDGACGGEACINESCAAHACGGHR